MTLSVKIYKIRKTNMEPIYDTKRYAGFDILADGNTFEDKFNNAFNVLKREIEEDKLNNDMSLYEPIVIADVFIS